MNFRKSLLLASALLAFTTPAAAQDGTEQVTTSAEATPDPARLAAAQLTVDHLFPLGTYERMMKGTMDQMMGAMLSGLGDMTMGDIAGKDGEGMSDEEKARTFSEATLARDPHFEERMTLSVKVMTNEMVDLMSSMEPAIREALTKIYARKYNVNQLIEMNAFFKTDSGSAFAKDYMMVFVDPEMIQSMMSLTPKMMQAMPDIMKKVEAATAHLPPEPKKTLEQTWGDEDDAEDVVEEAYDADAETNDEPDWDDPENWSAEDRAAVEKTEADYEAAVDAYSVAAEQASTNAKKRLAKDD